SGSIADREPLVVCCLEVIRLLGERVAKALEVSSCPQHLDERAFDSLSQALLVHDLAADGAASLVDRPGFKKALRLTHQRSAGKKACAVRGGKTVPLVDSAPIEGWRAQRLDLGQEILAAGIVRNSGRGTNRCGEPGRVDGLIERMGGFDTKHPANLLRSEERRVGE